LLAGGASFWVEALTIYKLLWFTFFCGPLGRKLRMTESFQESLTPVLRKVCFSKGKCVSKKLYYQK